MEENVIVQHFLFHPNNIKFIRGKTRWTEQSKHDVFELITSFPLIFLLMSFLWWSNIEFWTRLFLLSIAGIISFGVTFWFYLKLKDKRDLAHKGRLLSGKITDCQLTNKGGDTDIFEVKFIVNDKKCCFETHLSRKLAKTLPEKKIFVIYRDSDNFLVL